MYKIIYFLFSLCVVCLCSCSKKDSPSISPPDDVTPPPPSCEFSIEDFTIPATNLDTVYDYICTFDIQDVHPEPYSYFYPTFNPKDPNEIAFLRRDNNNWNGCNHELWTFNFCTGEATYLTDAVCYSLDWSVKNWIAFTNVGRDAYIIKANGENLTRLTNTGSYNNFPIWNSTGDEIAYKKKINSESYYIIIDTLGHSKDTISSLSFTSFLAWSSNNKFSCLVVAPDNQLKLGYYDYNLKSMNYLHDLNGVSPFDIITSTAWGNDNQDIFWTAKLTLNTTNITTGDRNKIWDADQVNRHYHSLDVSPDGKTIIIERHDFEKRSECEREVRETLYLADIDGSNQRKIVFPE